MLSDHDDIRVPIIYTFEKAIHRVQILSELVINVGCPGVQFVGCAGAFINRLEPWDCFNVLTKYSHGRIPDPNMRQSSGRGIIAMSSWSEMDPSF